jgi:hypothetical protein
MQPTVRYVPESIELFLEDQAFLRSYDSAPRPSTEKVVSLSRSSCVPPVELTDGGVGAGSGREPNHTPARKPGLLQTLNTLSGTYQKQIELFR